ncbi:MAG TPA: amino acid adenylation domain-containing protein, partial [Thermoanaerobaculia bacterium]|nr:amino acid adenylation domain-containing protein [Thermoanaerobaculia bacterium]
RLSLLTPEAAAVLPDPCAPLPAGEWTGAVHERFARQARLTPERLAIVDSQVSWTYGELAQRAGHLAHRLREEGIHKGDLVAVYAARSASLVEALLGILTIGAAFLILDPGHPAPRLRTVVSRARPRAWIEIAAAGPPPLELGEALPAVRIALDAATPAAGPAVEPVPLHPDDLAYVAFTSGSTGEPKGILGAQGPLAHFCDWHTATFGLGADDRFSLLSGLSHDPLLRDILTPLTLGARLSIPAADDLDFPQRLAGWMASQGITVSHLTPGLGQLLADGGTPLPALRRTFFGGDVLIERDVARLREVAPQATSVNFYGTTETPQVVAWHDASRAGAWPTRRVPVGRGIDGAQLLVLNDAGELAAPGELGEICVRTPYLSQGYLDDERLTAERFVANPITGDPADRVYRTGDLGRYRTGGEVVLAGRRDRQVQVRGFRVEPAEVEAALAAHPAVRDSAVLLRGGILTAFLVAVPGVVGARFGEMRDFLRRRLPDPMVPEAVVWLDRLPLTPNGKLDRTALESMDVKESKDDVEKVFEAPATPLEEAIAAIWCRLLDLEQVGRNDSFFELGGHSLLGARVIGAVREALGVEVPLRTLFEKPTVAEMARLVVELRGQAAKASKR